MSNSRPRELVLSGLLLVALTACANSRDAERREVAELGALHEVRHAEFLAGQEEFRARYPMPQRSELFGVGTLVVHEAALGGRLGQETLHVLFTWVNSTPFKTNGARVRITLRDATGQVEREQRVDLRSLVGAGFLPDCTYTSFVDLPTEGIQLTPGWDWTIELEKLPTVLGFDSGLIEQG